MQLLTLSGSTDMSSGRTAGTTLAYGIIADRPLPKKACTLQYIERKQAH